MTEPQFAYSTLTLDELRSLAASPQVGTIEAMPQSFRALADRVGEVADLLSHAQADLPNWWKGPAAEQAVATLGRAAAEAREFHDSAMGAATAVSRCAQVVAAQQNQMMNVPDVQEPGVTDVVQRPTTPFEALEAARQDTKYQAAHEQAVQVVNGIAAQYVETRSQLAMVAAPRGEDFDLSGNRLQPAETAAMRPDEKSLPIEENRATPSATANYWQPRQQSTEAPRHRETAPELSRSISSRQYPDAPASGLSIRTTTDYSPFPHGPRSDGKIKTDSGTVQGVGHGEAVNIIDLPPKLGTAANETYSQAKIKTLGRREEYDPSGKRTSATTKRGFSSTTSESHHAGTDPQTDYTTGSVTAEVEPTTSQRTDNPAFDDASSSNAGLIPPYSGIGAMHHGREERNPRPAYLKERKSAWLPETTAAPADGIITPDWFERS